MRKIGCQKTTYFRLTLSKSAKKLANFGGMKIMYIYMFYSQAKLNYFYIPYTDFKTHK